MPSLYNSTLSSSPDQDECQYWSSFSEKPLRCGDRLQVYKGKLNGKGPRGGDFSAVKVFADHPGTETRCCKELDKARAATDWLARFLAHSKYRPECVKIARLQMATMDQVSVLNKLFSHNKRRPSSGEWILLEEMVHERGTLVQFVDKCGRMCRERAASDSGMMGLRCLSGCSSSPAGTACRLNIRELLQAFVHYTHQASGGQLVICNLEGVENEFSRVILKTPVIHSQHRLYGETDRGPRGIEEVMNQHVCNRLCRQVLALPRSMSAPLPPRRSISSSDLFPRERRIPSAPYDEEGENMLTGCPLPSAPPYSLGELGLDVSQLPQDVFYLPSSPNPEELSLFFHLELAAKGIPEEPPPPYTEFIEDLM